MATGIDYSKTKKGFHCTCKELKAPCLVCEMSKYADSINKQFGIKKGKGYRQLITTKNK